MKLQIKKIIDVCTNRNCNECKFNKDKNLELSYECYYCDNGESWEPDYNKILEVCNLGGKNDECNIKKEGI